MLRIHAVCLALLGMASLGISGCGGASADQLPPLVPVSGTVRMDGRPLAGATVVFNPRPGSETVGGFGVTDENGFFDAKFRGAQPGIEPGEYVVTVSKLAQKDGSPIPEGANAADVEAVQVVPPAFSDLQRSQQMVTVSADGDAFDFDLASRKK